MIENYSEAVKNIRNEFKNYLLKSNLKSIVLGVSGGIDSALCAALAKPVCDETGIKLFCRSITISTNKPDEILRAKKVGEAFGNDFREVDLSEAFDFMLPLIAEDEKTADKSLHNFKIRGGNLKARLRMLYLFDLAAKEKGMVLSTDNYTELLLGFWTLHGDVGDYGMIQSLWKTEVYEMAKYLVSQMKNEIEADALMSCINAVPTDGLGITNSDLDQIGASSYEEVDLTLIEYLKNPDDKKYIENKVVQRKVSSEFKRTNPFNIPREKITEKKYY
jgi:NAD+ synthetase